MKEVKNTIFMAKDGVYEAYEIDYKNQKIGGYKLFTGHGESNSFRTFNIVDVQMKNLRP